MSYKRNDDEEQPDQYSNVYDYEPQLNNEELDKLNYLLDKNDRFLVKSLSEFIILELGMGKDLMKTEKKSETEQLKRATDMEMELRKDDQILRQYNKVNFNDIVADLFRNLKEANDAKRYGRFYKVTRSAIADLPSTDVQSFNLTSKLEPIEDSNVFEYKNEHKPHGLQSPKKFTTIHNQNQLPGIFFTKIYEPKQNKTKHVICIHKTRAVPTTKNLDEYSYSTGKALSVLDDLPSVPILSLHLDRQKLEPIEKSEEFNYYSKIIEKILKRKKRRSRARHKNRSPFAKNQVNLIN